MTRAIVVAIAIASVAVTRAAAPTPQTETAGAFDLPAPTGPYPVGTTTWRVTDPARKETFTATGEPRQVEVHAWYPAAAPRKPAPPPAVVPAAMPTAMKLPRASGDESTWDDF